MKYKHVNNTYIIEVENDIERDNLHTFLNAETSLKAKDVMRVLNISRQTLSNYVKQGLIKIDARINGKYRYNRKSVYDLLGQ